jgi:hypothetical protein
MAGFQQQAAQVGHCKGESGVGGSAVPGVRGVVVVAEFSDGAEVAHRAAAAEFGRAKVPALRLV